MTDMIREAINATVNWIKAHRFAYKVVGNVVYWQTNYQTLMYDAEADKTTCFKWEYFKKIG